MDNILQSFIRTKSNYLVVEFPDEEQDGYIPMPIISEKWLIDLDEDDQYCLWPRYFKSDTQRNKAVENHIELDAQNCGQSKIQIIYSTYDYHKALNKLKKLEENQYLSQTEEEEEQQQTRRKRSKKKDNSDFVDDYLSEDDLIPKMPKLSNIVNKQKKTVSLCTNQNERFMSSTPTSLQSVQSSGSSSFGGRCLQCTKNEGLISNLMTAVQQMQGNLQYLISLQQAQSSLAENPVINNTKITAVTNKEELDQLENRMAEPQEMSLLSAALQVVGGKDAHDTTRRILSKLIRNDFAINCNWSGKNDKIKFSDFTNVINLITVTVRKNPLSKNATKIEIENIIKVWLRNAADRDGGRTRRKKNNNN